MTRDTPEDVSTAGAKDILDVLNLLKGGEEKISEVELKLDEMEKENGLSVSSVRRSTQGQQ